MKLHPPSEISVLPRIQVALSAISSVLLVLALLKLETMSIQLKHPFRLSGQTVSTDSVVTERTMDESLEDWAERHRTAVDQFKTKEHPVHRLETRERGGVR